MLPPADRADDYGRRMALLDLVTLPVRLTVGRRPALEG